MPSFSKRSQDRLSTCRSELQTLFYEVVKGFDCTVLCGHRGRAEQTEAFESGRSKVRWPDGKHNSNPSEAVDVVPYPVNWNDLARFYFFGGYVKAKAEELGINIRWGGDWDGDTSVTDQNFNDLPHFELI